MTSLPAADRILDLHDALAGAGPARRATLLIEAGDGVDPATAAARPLGMIDADLLRLHERWFGPHLTAQARCPSCAATLDVALDAASLAGSVTAAPTEHTVTRGDITAIVRPLTLADLATAEGLSPRDARRALLRSGLVSVRRRGKRCDIAGLPAEAEPWLVGALATVDPQADLVVALACGDCGTAWEERLDVSAFLVARLAAMAARLIDEVHQLATAYGWTETTILGLSGRRRMQYLERAAA